MNEFVSWCRHLLVSFLFHVLTSLHPPSFHRNEFSTCSTHFSFILVQSPKMFSLRRLYARACARGEPTRARRFMHAHAHADNAPLLRTCNVRACYGVVQRLPMKSPTIYRRNLRREKNDRLVCTPPSTVETFGEEISAEACSGKEIAG